MTSINSNSLKKKLRGGLSGDAERSTVWPILPAVSNKSSSPIDLKALCDETKNAASSLYTSTAQSHSKPSDFRYDQNEKRFIVESSDHILGLLRANGITTNNDVQSIRSITVMLRIFLKVTTNVELSNMLIREIISNKQERYAALGPGDLGLMHFTFKAILKDYMPQTYSSLIKIGK